MYPKESFAQAFLSVIDSIKQNLEILKENVNKNDHFIFTETILES